MAHTMQQILADALTLPPVERAELIEKLFFSFDDVDRKTLDALWVAEAEDRLDAFQRGEFSTIPADEVFAKLSK